MASDENMGKGLLIGFLTGAAVGSIIALLYAPKSGKELMEDEIGAVLLGSDEKVAAGQKVRMKGEVLSVPVGEELLGRVVNPLGQPLDGGPDIKTKHRGLV